MYSLVEIVRAQRRISDSNLSASVELLIQSLYENKCISRKNIKSLFVDIKKSIDEFGSDDQKQDFDILYKNIYSTVYHYEQKLIEQKVNVKKFIKTLSEIQTQFYKDIDESKQEYSDAFDIDIEEYYNFFKLNLKIFQNRYYKNFTEKIPVFKNRIYASLEKKVYKQQWQDKDNFVNDLNDILELTNHLYQQLETFKKQERQKLLKERSRYVFNHFQWKDENDYFEYTKHWKSEFIIDEFLGIAGQYISWKYPLAYIEPNTGELTRHIISGDPFYVIDDRELPYDNIVESLPKASQQKIYHYNKKTALNDLEESSIGFCVSWNNFPFKTQGKIFNDMQLMSQLLMPGGYAVFNYADADSVQGAKFVEENEVSIIWKEKIDQYAADNQLTEISTHEHAGYPFSVAVYQKNGKPIDLNIINKLGLVLPDEKQLEQKRLEQAKENLKAKAVRSKLDQDLKRLQERDQLLQDLDEKRQLGQENILDLKLQKAINHLNNMIAAYDDYTHPSVLEGLLHVSKITYSLGRVKDSKNLIKRVKRDIEKMSVDNLIAKKYREWQNFLNNIDT